MFLGLGLIGVCGGGDSETTEADHEVALEEHFDGKGSVGRNGFAERKNQMVGLPGLPRSRPTGRSVPVRYIRGSGRTAPHAYFPIGTGRVEYLLFFSIHPNSELT